MQPDQYPDLDVAARVRLLETRTDLINGHLNGQHRLLLQIVALLASQYGLKYETPFGGDDE